VIYLGLCLEIACRGGAFDYGFSNQPSVKRFFAETPVSSDFLAGDSSLSGENIYGGFSNF